MVAGSPSGTSSKADAPGQVAERKAAKSESGKAGAPGQVCKDLKVKGKKTDDQRAAFKACIQDAVAQRKPASSETHEPERKRVPRKKRP